MPKYDGQGNFIPPANDKETVHLLVKWALIALVVIALLGVASWQLGWFVEEKNTDRQVHIDNRNLGTQTAWHDEVMKDIKDYELVPEDNTAARGALEKQICDLSGRLRSDYRNDTIDQFEEEHC